MYSCIFSDIMYFFCLLPGFETHLMGMQLCFNVESVLKIGYNVYEKLFQFWRLHVRITTFFLRSLVIIKCKTPSKRWKNVEVAPYFQHWMLDDISESIKCWNCRFRIFSTFNVSRHSSVDITLNTHTTALWIRKTKLTVIRYFNVKTMLGKKWCNTLWILNYLRV